MRADDCRLVHGFRPHHTCVARKYLKAVYREYTDAKINDRLVLIGIGRRIPCDGQPHEAKGPMRVNARAAEYKAVDRAAP